MTHVATTKCAQWQRMNGWVVRPGLAIQLAVADTTTGARPPEQNEQGMACRSARLVCLGEFTWHGHCTMKLLDSWCKCRATRVLRMNLFQACWNRPCKQSTWVCSSCVRIALHMRWVGTMWQFLVACCIVVCHVGCCGPHD